MFPDRSFGCFPCSAISTGTDLLTDQLKIGVAWGLGNGRFAPIASLLDDATGSIIAGAGQFLDDLDGDGWLDILVGQQC